MRLALCNSNLTKKLFIFQLNVFYFPSCCRLDCKKYPFVRSISQIQKSRIRRNKYSNVTASRNTQKKKFCSGVYVIKLFLEEIIPLKRNSKKRSFQSQFQRIVLLKNCIVITPEQTFFQFINFGGNLDYWKQKTVRLFLAFRQQ